MKKQVLIALLFAPALAYAGLGDQESSIEKDRQAVGAPSSAVQDKHVFKIHEMTAHSARIREFTNGSGKIFAISWRGVADPNLEPLLGSYYQEFQNARKNQKISHGRKPLSIKTANLVYQKSGHMRDLHSLVYLNGQLPAGIEPKDLQ